MDVRALAVPDAKITVPTIEFSAPLGIEYEVMPEGMDVRELIGPHVEIPAPTIEFSAPLGIKIEVNSANSCTRCTFGTMSA